MDPYKIIEKYYTPGSDAYKILVGHSERVARKAVSIGKKFVHYNPDLAFIEEASLLHDIGIYLTNAPSLGCHGDKPYICHGYLGREILDREGFPEHGLVCERHTGVGLTKGDIVKQRLPLPIRDMTPQTVEEEIICFADKFFSKKVPNNMPENSVDEILSQLAKHGEDKVDTFKLWLENMGE